MSSSAPEADPRIAAHHQHVAHVGRYHGLGHALRATRDVSGLNAKIAVMVTHGLGTMAAAYGFSLLSLSSLPAVLYAAHVIGRPGALASAGLILVVAWVAQTYIQLVALSVLQVSGNAQGRAQEQNTQTVLSDAQATREHSLAILDLLDTHTQGGLRDVLDAITKTKTGAP